MENGRGQGCLRRVQVRINKRSILSSLAPVIGKPTTEWSGYWSGRACRRNHSSFPVGICKLAAAGWQLEKAADAYLVRFLIDNGARYNNILRMAVLSRT